MAYDLATGKRIQRDFSIGASFGEDARRAIDASPDYFVKWYTIKSIGLGVVGAAFAFMLGRATAAPCRRS
jgi:hypothetical protein